MVSPCNLFLDVIGTRHYWRDGYTKTHYRKYIGYKEFARYISSGDDFLALRRFDRVHSRLLLVLQDQVVELESELDAIDARLSKRTATDLDNGCIRNDVQERRDVLEKLHRRVREYGEQPREKSTINALHGLF